MDYICNTADRLELGCLTEFQGGLKQRTAEDIEKIKKSIRRHGFAFPFFVWSHGGVNHVLDGHGRIQALKQMEKDGEAVPPLPVVYIDCRDEAEAKELLLKLNSHYGQMTADSVLEFIGDIDINLDDLALPSGLLELGDIADTDDGAEVSEDEVPEEPEEPSARLGDVYRLGRHRLICGDSTDSETIARLMDGQKADMVFTDPPYGMRLDTDYSSMKSKLKCKTGGSYYEKVIGDNDDFKPELITSIFENFGYCKEVFLFGGDYFAELLNGKNQGSWIVWDKRLDDSADKMFGSCFELCWSKNKHKRDIARVKWAGVFGMEQEDVNKRVHPTQKPVNLVLWFLSRYGKTGDLVVDIYGGSGSTLIACEQTGRRCYMCELEPRYIDVIIQRWETLTGEKAELLERAE